MELKIAELGEYSTSILSLESPPAPGMLFVSVAPRKHVGEGDTSIAQHFRHASIHFTTFLYPHFVLTFEFCWLLLVYLDLVSFSDACNKTTFILRH
jgi:hypothetical protein